MHTNIDKNGLAIVTTTIEGDGFGFDAGDLVVIDHYDTTADNWIIKSAFDSNLTCNASGNEMVAINVKDVLRYLKNSKEVKQ